MSPSLVPTLPNNYEDVYLNYDSTQKEIALDKIYVKDSEEYKNLRKELIELRRKMALVKFVVLEEEKKNDKYQGRWKIKCNES